VLRKPDCIAGSIRWALGILTSYESISNEQNVAICKRGWFGIGWRAPEKALTTFHLLYQFQSQHILEKGQPPGIVVGFSFFRMVFNSSYVADIIMLFVLFPISFHLISKEFKNPYHSFDSACLLICLDE